ncbi:MAG TPA: pyruvate dehydrogenase complex dihydrolipoamide acetyltransferase [Bacteroidetes bacterium]|nr:pyruvate dehydrogenase complex dihydrolipoamide acetyltransferase [Bacteroidota bacterium]
MATKVMMPKLSDTMEEGVILKWLRKEGEKIKQGETLVEIESDKADMELEAYDTGVLRKIIVPEGGKAKIGALIAVIGDPTENISSLLVDLPPASAAPALEGAKAQSALSPSIAESRSKSAEAPTDIPSEQPTDGRTKASPLARRLASEHNLNLTRIAGSGPQGRVIKRDVEGALSEVPGTTKQSIPQTYAAASWEDVLLSPIRRTIAKRMAESKSVAPHFYVTVEIDMEPVTAFRDQLNNAGSAKISFTDILIKAAASTLMKHPSVNATFLGEHSRQYHNVDIGVAVALEEGLVTPVVRRCEQKGIGTINADLRDLVDRARARKLKPDEYAGATFTISNLGMFGVEDFVAIINPPEGAILAVGAIVEKPVVRNGQIAVGHRMKVTLSADHRIIDGVVAARFLQDFKKIVENPAALAL